MGCSLREVQSGFGGGVSVIWGAGWGGRGEVDVCGVGGGWVVGPDGAGKICVDEDCKTAMLLVSATCRLDVVYRMVPCHFVCGK